MSASQLTKGAVERLSTDDSEDQIVDPVLQVLTLKKIQNNNESAPDRYRVILSDGEYYGQGELSVICVG